MYVVTVGAVTRFALQNRGMDSKRDGQLRDDTICRSTDLRRNTRKALDELDLLPNDGPVDTAGDATGSRGTTY